MTPKCCYLECYTLWMLEGEKAPVRVAVVKPCEYPKNWLGHVEEKSAS